MGAVVREEGCDEAHLKWINLVKVAVKCWACLSLREWSLSPMHAWWCLRRSNRGAGKDCPMLLSHWTCSRVQEAHVTTIRVPLKHSSSREAEMLQISRHPSLSGLKRGACALCLSLPSWFPVTSRTPEIPCLFIWTLLFPRTLYCPYLDISRIRLPIQSWWLMAN